MNASAPAPLVRTTREGAVATLTLASPSNRNALSLAMIEALIAELEALAADGDARVIVLQGEGPALSAGHDLREFQAHRNDADRGRAFYEREMARCADLMQLIVRLPKPVIASVEGVATAAGCQLVASCDLAIAGAKARFALPGVSIGLFCSTPLVAVGRAVSRKHAMELALTGDLIDAARAEAMGLVNKVVPEGEALASAQAMAAAIAARSADVIALGKTAFYRQIEAPLAQAYDMAGAVMVENLAHPDSAEGIGAFIEKRKPQWR